MLFETNEYYVDYVDIQKDLKELKDIYNSNIEFLINHINRSEIDDIWLINEITKMNNSNFKCCKIFSKNKNHIIGLVDFRKDKTCYLSLLMLHKNYKSKGLGKKIYNSIETYLKFQNCSCIRIDVVYNYNKNIMKFWTNRGFKKVKNVELNWAEKKLSAICMIKYI